MHVYPILRGSGTKKGPLWVLSKVAALTSKVPSGACQSLVQVNVQWHQNSHQLTHFSRGKCTRALGHRAPTARPWCFIRSDSGHQQSLVSVLGSEEEGQEGDYDGQWKHSFFALFVFEITVRSLFGALMNFFHEARDKSSVSVKDLYDVSRKRCGKLKLGQVSELC